MTAPNRNMLWGQALTDELARCGVTHVALSPGSRSTPLVLAFANDDRFTLYPFLDERSAGFFALGVGKRTGAPAAVVTTSGTAVANLLPAVVEADASDTPLVVLSADRAHRLRGQDANQTIDQVHLFGSRVRRFVDVSPPDMTPAGLRHIRQLACHAVADARAPWPGPVHLNLPFDKPLGPTPVPGDVPEDLAERDPVAVHGRADGAPFSTPTRATVRADDEAIASIVTLLDQAERPMIVAGPCPDPHVTGPAIGALVRELDAPLVADLLSGARTAAGATEARGISHDVLLEPLRTSPEHQPDLILRIGSAPTSSATQRWLAHHRDVDQVVLAPPGRHHDHDALARMEVIGALDHTLRALVEATPSAGEPTFRAAWRDADARARAVVDDHVDARWSEAGVARTIVEQLPPAATLVIGNSMAVRQLDGFARERDEPLRLVANRGASGIDGLVSTAIGAAATSDGPTVALLGDLSFLHDLNGLAGLRHVDADVTFVVVNNDGGGIFHHLPLATQEPAFERLFATPHELDLADAAALHRVPHARCGDRKAFTHLLHEALQEGGPCLIETISDRVADHQWHLDVRAAVAQRLASTQE